MGYARKNLISVQDAPYNEHEHEREPNPRLAIFDYNEALSNRERIHQANG